MGMPGAENGFSDSGFSETYWTLAGSNLQLYPPAPKRMSHTSSAPAVESGVPTATIRVGKQACRFWAKILSDVGSSALVFWNAAATLLAAMLAVPTSGSSIEGSTSDGVRAM